MTDPLELAKQHEVFHAQYVKHCSVFGGEVGYQGWLEEELGNIQDYIHTIRLNIPAEYTKQPQLDLCMQRMKEDLIRREEGVLVKRTVIDMGACGACESNVFRHDNWCGHCGTRLKWPKEKVER